MTLLQKTIIFVFTLTSFLKAEELKLSNNELSYIHTNSARVAMLPDFPPFSIYKNNVLKGFSYDILELISKKSGLQLTYIINTGPKNIENFKEKKVDIILAHFNTTQNSSQEKNYPNIKALNELKLENLKKTDFQFTIEKENNTLHSILSKGLDSINQLQWGQLKTKWLSVSSNTIQNNLEKKETAVKFEQGMDYTFIRNILIFISFIIVYFVYKHVVLKQYNQRLEHRVKEEVRKRREKERQMLHQSRLAQMGELISMVAHQWKQPLNSIAATTINIQTHIELEKFDLTEVEQRKKFILFLNKEFNKIELFTHTLSDTMDDFTNFYKPHKNSELLQIHSAIQIALTIIQSSLKSNDIKLVEDYNSNSKLPLYQNELVQVILNLIKNSQDNFKEKNTQNPTITITTQDVKNGITLEIRDNGSGIEEEIIDQIYDPYFSTKKEKKGTGLGLYMSKIIIEEHHKGKFYTKEHKKGIGFIMFIPK